MQAGNYQLRRDEEQNHRRNPEEFLQVHPHAALYEHNAEQNGRTDAEQSYDD